MNDSKDNKLHISLRPGCLFMLGFACGVLFVILFAVL